MFEYLAGWGVFIFLCCVGGAFLNWSSFQAHEYQRGFNDAMQMKEKQAAINFENEQKEKLND